MPSCPICSPVLLVNWAPMVGTSEPLCSPPNARSVAASAPKLYVSPELPEPVPAVYSVLALVPASSKYQPVGSALEVPLAASVSKGCVEATPMVVSATLPPPTAPAPPTKTRHAQSAPSNAIRLLIGSPLPVFAPSPRTILSHRRRHFNRRSRRLTVRLRLGRYPHVSGGRAW